MPPASPPPMPCPRPPAPPAVHRRIINESLELAFQDVVTYTKTYDPFKDIYIENTKLDTDEVKSKGYSLEWFKDQVSALS